REARRQPGSASESLLACSYNAPPLQLPYPPWTQRLLSRYIFSDRFTASRQGALTERPLSTTLRVGLSNSLKGRVLCERCSVSQWNPGLEPALDGLPGKLCSLL